MTKRAEQLQNDYEISESPKLAEIIRAKILATYLVLAPMIHHLPFVIGQVIRKVMTNDK